MDARPTIEQRQFWRAGPFLGRDGRCDHALGARCGSTVERCLAVGTSSSISACPFSYLAAERVERALGDVDWVPCSLPAARRQLAPDLIARAERQAFALQLPLVWPDRFPRAGPDRAASRRIRRRDRRRRAVCAGREQAGVLWRLRPRGPRDPRRGRRGCGGSGRPMPRRRGRSRSRRSHAGDRPAPCVLRGPAPARDSHRTALAVGRADALRGPPAASQRSFLARARRPHQPSNSAA